MKQQEVFKKIGGIINELKEQYEYLESVNDCFNDLELELLAANSQFLTDHIEVLRKLNRQLENAIKTPLLPADKQETTEHTDAASAFEPDAEEENTDSFYEQAEPDVETPIFEFEVPRREENLTNEEGDNDDDIQHHEEEPAAEPEIIKHELTLDEIGDDWEEDEHEEDLIVTEEDTLEMKVTETITVEPVAEPETAPATPTVNDEEHETEAPEPEPVMPVAEAEQEVVPEPEPEPVNAQEAEEEEPIALAKPVAQPAQAQITIQEETVVTYNQRILAQLGNTNRMSDQLSTQPVTDLKSAISLNDKLLYIKDLFNGYSLAYSEAIDLLNRSNSFEEAEKFLMTSYATKNNWKDKQNTVDKFFALLRRKFNA